MSESETSYQYEPLSEEQAKAQLAKFYEKFEDRFQRRPHARHEPMVVIALNHLTDYWKARSEEDTNNAGGLVFDATLASRVDRYKARIAEFENMREAEASRMKTDARKYARVMIAYHTLGEFDLCATTEIVIKNENPNLLPGEVIALASADIAGKIRGIRDRIGGYTETKTRRKRK
jgi:hypothetical protein